MNKKTLQVLIHVIAWAGFLALPSLSSPDNGFEQHPALVQLFNSLFVGNVLLICIFYLNYFFITPLYLKSQYLQFCIYSILVSSIFFVSDYFLRPSPELFVPQLSPIQGQPVPPPSMFFHFVSVIMFLIVYFISFGLRVTAQWKITKEEKLQAELSYLKAQINPHFLFNTLNNIYSLTLIKSDEAPSIVLKLSSMMRYSITEALQNYISLRKEIDYITNYIALQRLRLPSNILIGYHVAGEAEGKVISPFMLIPFIENAFKHGINTAEDTNIEISITISEKTLVLKVCNKKVMIKIDNESSGIGIENTKRRLQYFYPSKHKLVVQENTESFSVLLTIQLT